ncbi:precorrin-6A reductase [Hoeflea marina]|uniref:Precorrin-6A reductase n=1 Tax=Hoeflea marina TaxID=274592 RepID=A0A317PHQ6_9HYPH|nr:cobalt-precorrin-6A reductase [Hoeflea marina]PWV98968.1 precorrin-6A reductase [Hoeflea marina]
MPADTILILGGTSEAASLAGEMVAALPGARIVTSLAGRTRQPVPVAGEVRSGGFGGAAGLAQWIRDNRVTRLIDATHPFATQISRNAVIASEMTGVPLEVRSREPWPKRPGDLWTEVATLGAARDTIPSGARVLLALGSQHIEVFASRADVHFVIRMVDAPETPPALPDHSLVLGRPGATVEAESALLHAHAITHIVCRNSGGAGAYAKIEAARRLELPVIMVGRD